MRWFLFLAVIVTATSASAAPTQSNPAFLGIELWFQYAIADPQGAYLGIVSISDGLHVLIGN